MEIAESVNEYSLNKAVLDVVKKSSSLQSILFFPYRSSSFDNSLDQCEVTLKDLTEFALGSTLKRITIKNFELGKSEEIQKCKDLLAQHGITFLT